MNLQQNEWEFNLASPQMDDVADESRYNLLKVVNRAISEEIVPVKSLPPRFNPAVVMNVQTSQWKYNE